MTPNARGTLPRTLPVVAVVVCVAVGLVWFSLDAPEPETERVPIERAPVAAAQATPPANPGSRTSGPGTPSTHPGSWPQFRGAARDNIARSRDVRVARSWPESGPRELWRITVGEGHAGVAVHRGRVYLVDYDRDKGEDAIRCLSLDDAQEIWRYSYSVEVKRNHGMSRTVPAVTDRYVVAIGPKSHVHCLDADSGDLVWKMDLVADYGTVTPPWYAGQCPLIDGDRVILAPGATPLVMAVDLATGREIWRSPPKVDDLGMTHSSVLPIEFGGVRQYVYCALKGVVSVAADDGRVLWTKLDWTIKIANIPSPLDVGGGRIFLTGGYDAGSAMIRLASVGAGGTAVEELYRLKAKIFSAEQHTPILYRGHLYAVIPNGELACMDLEGNVRWTSGPERRFGLGPWLIVDDLLLVLDDTAGTLHLARAHAKAYDELAQAKVLEGHDAWGPMAYAEGRIIVRDLTEMVCVDLSE
jgi:outer membrane protein assembly factor BamB